MNLENMMIKWTSGEGKISNSHLEFGNVAVKWKSYLVLE